MHLSISAAALLALSLAGPTIAGRPFFCPLALDAKFIQVPYCCEGFVPARDSKVSFEGVNCIDVSSDEGFVKTCPKGGTPKCCYSMGPKIICTTEVGDGLMSRSGIVDCRGGYEELKDKGLALYR